MMSKIKLLLDVVKDLKSLADSVQAVADAMSENDTTTTEPIQAQKPVEATVSAKKAVSLEEVRTVLADKSRMVFTVQVRELLVKYGEEKLSAVNPKVYPALLADA